MNFDHDYDVFSQRIHELEMELETEQQRHGETAKSMRRQERRLKELTAQLDEDRTTHERMHDVIDKLHQKLKTYKRQIDDAVYDFIFDLYCSHNVLFF